ncbi:MAG: sigma-70 family RNA polymerase sigma factor [Deferrisomatales bacterium]|nr:sigma-70 family RNA polymerase sigma factor [Deferrisomatales bacterium]
MREAPSDAEAWDHVIRWVEENRALLVGNAQRTYAGFGPYDREDYIQQATLAGFHAWKDCVRAGEPERFVGYLFVRMRRECRDEMGIRRDAPASLRSKDRVLVPIEGLPHSPEAAGNDSDEEQATRRRALLWQALRWMTPRQQVAWLLALGYMGHGEATPKDIARALKISRRAAAGLLARGRAQAERRARREKHRSIWTG